MNNPFNFPIERSCSADVLIAQTNQLQLADQLDAVALDDLDAAERNFQRISKGEVFNQQAIISKHNRYFKCIRFVYCAIVFSCEECSVPYTSNYTIDGISSVLVISRRHAYFMNPGCSILIMKNEFLRKHWKIPIEILE